MALNTNVHIMKTFFTSCLCLLVFTSIYAQNPVNLKFNLEKSKHYSIKSVSNQTIQQNVSGQQVNITIKSNRVVTFQMLDKANDAMTLALKFDTIASSISYIGGNQETNSTKPGNTPAEKILNKLSALTLKIKVSTTGRFLSYVNYGTFRDSILMVLDDVPVSLRDAAKKQAETLIKESALTSMFEPMFAYLPDKDVKPGDVWENSSLSTSNDISFIVMNKTTCADIKNNQVAIKGESAMESMPSTDPNATTTTDLKGTSTFSGTIDAKTGLCTSKNEKGHFAGSAKVKQGGQEYNVQMSIDSQSDTFMSY